jgi:rhomboid protease GluP
VNEPRRPRLRTPATAALLVSIGVVFIAQLFIGDTLIAYGANTPMRWLLEHGQYWRLLTSMFLHGDGSIPGTVLHFALNIYALLQLGTLYEIMFGTRRFVLIYFASGLIASIASSLHIDGISVGASGAVFGILGALVSSIRRSPKYKDDRRAKNIAGQCVFWIIANIVLGFQIPQIDNAAHIGGLIAGILIGALLPYREPPPPPSAAIVDV